MKKIIYIIGPESSGSIFIAKTIASAIGLCDFSQWDGHARCPHENDSFSVHHFSQPHYDDPTFTNIEDVVSKYKNHDLMFVLCTRDQNICEKSRIKKHAWQNRSIEQIKNEMEECRNILENIIQNHTYFIWSYETMCFLKDTYLKCLLNWIGIDGNFSKPVVDGNKKYIQ